MHLFSHQCILYVNFNKSILSSRTMDLTQDHSEKKVKTHLIDNEENIKDIPPNCPTMAETQRHIKQKNAILSCFKILDKIGSHECQEANEETIDKANNLCEWLTTRNWSDEICYWSATLQSYPKRFWCDYKSGWCDCIFCKQAFHVIWAKVFMARLTGEEALSLCSIPGLVYFSIYACNDNVQVHFIDCTGEFSSLMEIPDSDHSTGTVWYADVWDEVWWADKPLSLEFWKDFKDEKNHPERYFKFDVYPIKVENSIGDFFKKFEETGQVPRNSIMDQMTFTNEITQ